MWKKPFCRTEAAYDENKTHLCVIAMQWSRALTLCDVVCCHLSMQRVLGGQFVLQFVVEVVDVCGLPLSREVAFLQRGYPLLHVLPLSAIKYKSMMSNYAEET